MKKDVGSKVRWLAVAAICALPLQSALPAAATTISKTGQSTCYDSSGTIISCADTGQDADLLIGVPWPNPRFRDNGDETLTDTLTSLTWPKDAGTFGPDACAPNMTKTWQEALDFVKCLNNNHYLGSINWHLPNISELSTLLNYGSDNTTWLTTSGYRNISNSSYWSSTTDTSDNKTAWTLSLQSRQKNSADKLNGLHVLPVKADPDLIVTNIASPPNANTGQAFSFPVTTKNIGSVTANGGGNGLIYTNLYLSTDETYSADDTFLADTLINTFATSSAPGAEWTRTASVTLPPVSSGNYYICGFADATNAVDEGPYESNNTACVAIAVTRQYADLVVTALSPPPSANTGQAFAVSVTTQNNGTVTANGGNGLIYTNLYLSTDETYSADDTFLADTLINAYATSSAPGAEWSKTPLVTLPPVSSGNYYICGFADATNAVDEGPHESNNTACVAIAVTRQYADLVVSALSPPSSANTGQAFNVSVTTQNNGTVTANGGNGLIYTKLYLSTDASYSADDTFLADTLINTSSTSSAPGATWSKTPLVTLPPVSSGNYYICGFADATNAVDEGPNESNNTACVAIAVTRQYADLVVSALSPPSSAYTGQAFDVPVTTQNNGTVTANGGNGLIYTKLYLSTDASYSADDTFLADTLINTSSTSSAPGATWSKTPLVTLPPVNYGNYYICAFADATNAVEEGPNESNNTACVAIVVTRQYADLVVSALSPPSSANTGQAFSVPVSTKNNGTVTANGGNGLIYTKLYLSTDASYSADDTFLADTLINTSSTSSAPGAEWSKTASVTLPPVSSGNYYICGFADATNAVDEGPHESNNTACVAIAVTRQYADLVVAALSPPPSAITGQAFGVTVTTKNNGTVTANGGNGLIYTKLYLSTDASYSAGDILLADTLINTSSTSSAPGATWSKTPSVTLPSVSTGDYYICAFADATNAVEEGPNESNNTACVAIAVTRP